MRVLITGGSGAIGHHVVREMAAHGHEVVVVDRQQPSCAPAGVSFRCCDLTDLEAALAAVRDADVIFHLAAIPNPYRDPWERVLTVNVVSAFNVLEAARRNGVGRVVYASSESASGFGIHQVELRPLYIPIDEEHPCWPHESYGLSKLFGEVMLANYARAYGLEGIALRYVWVWTERDRAAVRELIRARLAGEPIAGWSGTYIAPEDVAQAFRLAAAYSFPTGQEPRFEAFYLAAEDTVLTQPTLDALRRHFDPLPEIRDPRYFEANPFAPAFDTRKAQRVLGWRPTKTWRDYVDW
jgi:UDP-glucose 4-epimerase